MWLNRRRDVRVRDELQFHRDRLTADYMAAGMSRAEAERRVFLEFGGVAAIEERVKDARGRWLEDIWRDVRCASRSLRKNPAFASSSATTLSLAVGAITAMFSLVHAIVLRPVPYRAPHELAMLWTEDPSQNLREGRSALWAVEAWRDQSQSFDDIATFDALSMTLSAADGAEQIVGGSMSANLLPLLGIQPAPGRSFSAEEAEQQQPVALLSHRFWQTHFGGANDAVGGTVVLNGRPSRIIGILPAGFQAGRLDADVWVPHAASRTAADQGGSDGDTWFAIGRLRPDVTLTQAQAEMTAIARRLNEHLPVVERNRGIAVVPLSLYLVGPESRLALWMLGGAVLLVFLIAAANVTSLSLARSVARAPEIAVRVALGASAGRIARQVLTESVLLAAIAGPPGTLLAYGAVRLVRAFGPATLPHINDISIDLRAVACALAASLVAGILVGIAPALSAIRGGARSPGEQSGQRVSGSAGARKFRRALVIAEFAMAVVLLVGAGLLVRTWRYVTGIDPGFRPERVVVMEISAPPAFTAPAQRAELYERVLAGTRAVAGVESTGLIGDLFIANSREQIVTVERNDGAASERLRLRADEVSPDFFTAIGSPLLRGRLFSTRDTADAPPVAIINEAMARRAWPAQDPLGRRFRLGDLESDRPWLTVVGVVSDMRRQGLEREPIPQMFVSVAQSPPRSVDMVVRTASDPLAIAAALRAAVRRVEKDAPLYGIASLEQEMGAYLTERRFQTSVLIAFSIVALLMAAVGIYGLVQYSVAARTREIGLRQAIGARAADIFRMVIGEGLMLGLAGLGVGLLGAWWLERAIAGLLFGVAAGDPLTFAAVALLLVAVAAAASYLPARRAMAVDPLTALRDGV
jgi:putative ABC transport system permease protein